MGWSGGVYTRERDFTDDEANGIKMLSANFDEEHDSIETGLNNCLTKDGTNSPSANLPMSTHRHTGVGDATERNEYATLGQLQDNYSRSATTAGSANTYTLTLSPAPTAYADGQVFVFKAHISNTGTSSLNVNDLGAVTIYQNLTALEADDITINRTYMVVYYSSAFHLFSQIAAAETPQYKIVTEYFGSNDTWTCPDGVTEVRVQCWGGGGGGGSNYGGQGGCYAESCISVTPSTGYSITIGAAGSSGGGAGGDTSFGSSTVLAKGGLGNGSARQTGSIGTLTVYGGTGLQYTKDMDSTIEGYLGGVPFGACQAPNMFQVGQNPSGGGSSQRAPTTASYAGGIGMIILTYVELV